MNAAGLSCENCQFEYDELHHTYEKKNQLFTRAWIEEHRLRTRLGQDQDCG